MMTTVHELLVITVPIDYIENAYAATAHTPSHVTREYGVKINLGPTFLECPSAICLFTIQLLLGYNDD